MSARLCKYSKNILPANSYHGLPLTRFSGEKSCWADGVKTSQNKYTVDDKSRCPPSTYRDDPTVVWRRSQHYWVSLALKLKVSSLISKLYLPFIKSTIRELRLREIQCEICFFIHQLFIDDHVFHGQPVLCKLLHFQGYSPDAISCLVHGVPSMHICVSFVPELLKYTNLELRSFAIQLLSHLVYHYPIPRTFELSKIAIRVAFTLLEGRSISCFRN